MERRFEGVAERSSLILVDSSVWVDFFSSKPGRGGAELRRMIEESEPFAMTGVVVAEVLQGLTRDSSRIEGFLAQWHKQRGCEDTRVGLPTPRPHQQSGNGRSGIQPDRPRQT